MNGAKILEVVGIYDRRLSQYSVERADVFEYVSGSHFTQCRHLRHCCAQIREFVLAGRIEKAFRWLGFIQGVLWSQGVVRRRGVDCWRGSGRGAVQTRGRSSSQV